MFWEGVNRNSPGTSASPMDRERVESWIRAQMALESRKVDEKAEQDSRQGSLGHMSQHGPELDVEVTNVTPFRSECGTHTLYALTCRKGDKQWRVFERYSIIRRIYDIARVSYPFVDGRRRGDTPGVCFPDKMLLKSSQGALQRAEGLLLWLSTYSHVPIVADFLMGDRSISGGLVQSQRSPQSRSEASTVGHQNMSVHPSLNGQDDSAPKGDVRVSGGEDAEAGSTVSRSTLTLSALRGGSDTAHFSRDDGSSGGTSRQPSQDGNASSRSIATSGTSGISSLGVATGTKRWRVAFLPASSPVKEMSPYSASPASARMSAAPHHVSDSIINEALSPLSLNDSMQASAEMQRRFNMSADSSVPAKGLSPHGTEISRQVGERSRQVGERSRQIASSAIGAAAQAVGESAAGLSVPDCTAKSSDSGNHGNDTPDGNKDPELDHATLELFDRTPSQTHSISTELHRMLNLGTFWHAARQSKPIPSAERNKGALKIRGQAGGEQAKMAQGRNGNGQQELGAEPAHPGVSDRQRDLKTVSLRAKAEQWLLKPEEVSVGKRMGQGAGGVIYHAKWRGLDVVAKMLRPEGERDGNINREVARNDLINEICLLSHLRHPCLVMFLGAVLSPDANGETLLILNEYMSGGNLEDFFTAKHRQLGVAHVSICLTLISMSHAHQCACRACVRPHWVQYVPCHRLLRVLCMCGHVCQDACMHMGAGTGACA